MKKRRGSATVEATMIFPLIMFIFFGIIYLTIIHYQNNVMIAESIRAMNRAGAYWQYIDMGVVSDNNKKKIDYIDYDAYRIPFPFDNQIPAKGIINFRTIDKRNAYRSLIDLISEAVANISNEKIQLTKKKANSVKYVESRLSDVKFKKYTSDKDTVVNNFKGEGFMFFGDDLSVEINRSYNNPFFNLASSLEVDNSIISNNKINRDVKVKSVISNQAEFIRNLDSVYDLGVTIYNIVVPKTSDSKEIDEEIDD